MSYKGKIYKLRYSADEGQPYVNLGKHPWKGDDWNELSIPFLVGVDLLACKKLYLQIDHPRATEWDYYSDCGCGTNGLISQRAKDLLGDYLRESSNFLQTTINDQPFYYLLRDERKTIDCWNRENSVFEASDIIKTHVAFRKIERLSFFRDKLTDPMTFRVPEYYAILVTKSIKQMIEDAQLRGFEFVDCDDMLWSHYS